MGDKMYVEEHFSSESKTLAEVMIIGAWAIRGLWRRSEKH